MTPPSDPITELLQGCYTGVLHDVMRDAGLRDFVLPPEIRPILPERRLCGPAFTILGNMVADADPHQTLLAWTGLLSTAPAGHIWVCQPNDHTIAHMGELSAETLHARGVLGCVIDGGIRDTGFMAALGFQCWSRFHTPRDIVSQWLPDGFDVPIVIGEVHISPGDFLSGDRDGLIRIPTAIVGEVTGEAELAIQTENKVRTAILKGVDPQEAYLKYGKF